MEPKSCKVIKGTPSLNLVGFQIYLGKVPLEDGNKTRTGTAFGS